MNDCSSGLRAIELVKDLVRQTVQFSISILQVDRQGLMHRKLSTKLAAPSPVEYCTC